MVQGCLPPWAPPLQSWAGRWSNQLSDACKLFCCPSVIDMYRIACSIFTFFVVLFWQNYGEPIDGSAWHLCCYVVYGAIISPSIPRVYNEVGPYLSLMRLKHALFVLLKFGLCYCLCRFVVREKHGSGFSFVALPVSWWSCELNFEPVLVTTVGVSQFGCIRYAATVFLYLTFSVSTRTEPFKLLYYLYMCVLVGHGFRETKENTFRRRK